MADTRNRIVLLICTRVDIIGGVHVDIVPMREEEGAQHPLNLAWDTWTGSPLGALADCVVSWGTLDGTESWDASLYFHGAEYHAPHRVTGRRAAAMVKALGKLDLAITAQAGPCGIEPGDVLAGVWKATGAVACYWTPDGGQPRGSLNRIEWRRSDLVGGKRKVRELCAGMLAAAVARSDHKRGGPLRKAEVVAIAAA